jgi:hypothetical protein
MRFQIFYTVNGEEDSFVVSGDDHEAIRQQANEELAKRGGTDPYSVPLDD